MYETSLQQILAELERLDLLLRVQVWRARQGRGEAGDMAAFHVPDAEAEEFLGRPVGEPGWASVPLPDDVRTAVQEQLLADLDARRAELQQTLLRISGAIQVLEELLAGSEAPPQDGSVPPAKAAARAGDGLLAAPAN